MLSNAVALFGGSFNPPTKAHLSVIEGLSRRFSEVIVMPAYVSPFKKGAVVLEGSDRVELIKGACKDFPNVTVDTYELDKGEVSYTYLTVEELKKRHENLYLVIGSDNIPFLEKWKNIDYLLQNVNFYVVTRPFFEVSKEDKAILERLRAKYEIADFVGEEGSSTLVSVANGFGKIREVVPKNVADFIEEKGLYRDYCYLPELYARFNMKESRVTHTYGTAKAAIVLANKFGADVKKAIVTALYHDLGKYVSVEEAENMGCKISPEAKNCTPSVVHAYVGAAIARDILGVTDEEILRAIELHTTGNSDMTVLDEVIFCADYIEEGRDTPGVGKIREAVYADLEVGMAKIVDSTIDYLLAKRAVIDVRTLACKKWIRKKLNSTTGDKKL